MKRVFFSQNNDYKKITPFVTDPNFIPLAVINDVKAQKNGPKKTVFWVKKKPKEEDGTIKGEKWTTSQQYIGDWKDNKKHGYGIKIYDNKDKYEGYWKNDLRDGKGTYWVCIGKNKYRKLYTGDWFENQKHGQGIYFYKDGSCYDGTWKNSKRDGKGLMIYANGDVYEGSWVNDLKHGYGILEKKGGDKYYGYWNEGLKEGQGYYYYYQKGKIYMGEWHEDVPRCGVYTDVDDENVKKEFKKHFRAIDPEPQIPTLKLINPEGILEECIDSVHFIRNVKMIKNKNVHELFGAEFQNDLILFFIKKQNESELEKEEGIKHFNSSKGSENYIVLSEFKMICLEKLGVEVRDETIELIFFIFGFDVNEESKIDFQLFCRLFYLIYIKKLIDTKEDPNVTNYEQLNEEDISEFYNENGELQTSKKQVLIDENKILMEGDYSNEEEPENEDMP